MKGYLSIIIMLLVIACNTKEKPENHIYQSQQWEIGVALYSFNQFSFAEALDKSNKAGAEYIEGFSFHELGDEFKDRSILALSDEELVKMKEMIDEQGLRMRSLYAGAESEMEWKKIFKIANILNLEFLVGEPDRKHWDFLNNLAGEYGIQIAIHQHAKGSSRYWHPDSVLTAIKGRENFAACADLGHWVRSGLDPVKSLALLKGHLISIHAKDLDHFGEIEANDVKIGNGVIDYEAVIDELNRQKFNGTVYVEAEHDWEDNLESVQFAVDYLSRLRDKQSK